MFFYCTINDVHDAPVHVDDAAVVRIIAQLTQPTTTNTIPKQLVQLPQPLARSLQQRAQPAQKPSKRAQFYPQFYTILHVLPCTCSYMYMLVLSDWLVAPAVCSPNPCKNGGTCSITGSSPAPCSCLCGWSGQLCTTRMYSAI